jgi:hypothetical protein
MVGRVKWDPASPTVTWAARPHGADLPEAGVRAGGAELVASVGELPLPQPATINPRPRSSSRNSGGARRARRDIRMVLP